MVVLPDALGVIGGIAQEHRDADEAHNGVKGGEGRDEQATAMPMRHTMVSKAVRAGMNRLTSPNTTRKIRPENRMGPIPARFRLVKCP